MKPHLKADFFFTGCGYYKTLEEAIKKVESNIQFLKWL